MTKLDAEISDASLRQSLDWLKNAAGVDDAYLARWSTAEWREWARAMQASRTDPCPSVPAWMAQQMPQWSWDFSLPFPCVAQLWPTYEDWFGEADQHADLTLEIEEPGEGWEPRIDQVREAWAFAASNGANPCLSISVVPGAPVGESVVGRIEAFYVTGSARSLERVAGDLARILGIPGAEPIGPLRGESALAWEWMYG